MWGSLQRVPLQFTLPQPAAAVTPTAPGLAMDLPIPFLLLVQGINTLLNWSLVLIQRAHLTSSFMGAFCVSLTVVDTLFTANMLAIYKLQDFSLFGMRFTSHHICLLVQISGLIYGVLQWPVLFAAGLDHYGSLSVGPKQTHQVWKLHYAACASILWASALLYVFLGPGFHLVLEDSPHLLLDHCQTQNDYASSQISIALLVTVGCVTLYARIMVDEDKLMEEVQRHSVQKSQKSEISRTSVLVQALITFTKTWAAFLLLVVAVLALQTPCVSTVLMKL
ncbi:probable G-protein coupled receptor 160 [Clupea harengus]|uniref:Probable G-protein coupled receptor 160 n=1 Tax=Clupea harengus TaxID=7950 RepID=A0A6P8EWH9_CLUHA|nr:probable G-protein coupled receptor 160 [Clupea harengus]